MREKILRFWGGGLQYLMTVYTVSEGHTGNLLRPIKIAVFRALAGWSGLQEEC